MLISRAVSLLLLGAVASCTAPQRFVQLSSSPSHNAPVASGMVCTCGAPPPPAAYIVFFDVGEAVLSPKSIVMIASAARGDKTLSFSEIDIFGYTDTSGTPAINEKLSADRAIAVRDELVTDGVSRAKIIIHFGGQNHHFITTNGSTVPPELNRSVVIEGYKT